MELDEHIRAMQLRKHGAPSRDDILREIARELQMRRNVFPKWIESGKLKPDEAKRRIDRLQAAYDFVMHHMPE